jgi:sensor histidine kinase regulating citrate/malate metabolism
VYLVIGTVLAFVAVIILLVVLLEQDKKVLLQEQLRETRHAMELEQNYYRETEKRHEELIKIRHDFNNHLAAIAQLINAGEQTSAQDMITTLSKKIIETDKNYCNIPVVNAILTEKAKTCTAAGINLVVELKLPPVLEIEQLHLCSIFGNLLDNAINACKKMPNPTIQITAAEDGDYLFIKSQNPSKPPQKPAPGRGLGLRIVSDIAAHCHGDYSAEYENGIYTVMVSLLATGGKH